MNKEYEFTAEELKPIIDGLEQDVEFFVDDETPFSIDETLEYLKLYPDNTMYVVVPDVPDFEEKIDSSKQDDQELEDQVMDEEENVTIDPEMSQDEMNTRANPDQPDQSTSTNQVPMESFAIIRSRNKKNLPDGVYLANLLENKMYGSFDDLKVSNSSIIIEGNIFKTQNKIDLKESKTAEAIELLLTKESKIKLDTYIKENKVITIDV